MEVKEYITALGTIISAILIVSGWFISKIKDREQEKFKLTHSRREEMVKLFLKLDNDLTFTGGAVANNVDFTSTLFSLLGAMRLYGINDEYKTLMDFIESFAGSNASLVMAKKYRELLKRDLTISVRSELGFEPIEADQLDRQLDVMLGRPAP